MSIVPKQNNVVGTDRLNVALCAAILSDILIPDSCRFMMLGIPNVSPLSETFLVAGMNPSITLSHVTPVLSSETVSPL